MQKSQGYLYPKLFTCFSNIMTTDIGKCPLAWQYHNPLKVNHPELFSAMEKSILGDISWFQQRLKLIWVYLVVRGKKKKIIKANFKFKASTINSKTIQLS